MLVLNYRIANAVATYILNEVLTGTDADFRKLVESFDWYVVPVANPDGYVYTHTKVSHHS